VRFWWVNQNKTFNQETAGGYLWSPKRNTNGARNPFYEFMREVTPGDLVLSFQGTYIRAIGVVKSHAYECPKPSEFGDAGPNWSAIGWRVDVSYEALENQIRPADHIDHLRHLLPKKYSPLLADGRGLQSIYLTRVPPILMEKLIALIGSEVSHLIKSGSQATEHKIPGVGLAQWEEQIRRVIENDQSISATEREQIVLARRGQGRFKENVRRFEDRCRITGVDRIEHLRASHIKPWRDCEDYGSRLDGENGLLLTPSMDHLFDRGFISFTGDGRLLVSPVAHSESLRTL